MNLHHRFEQIVAAHSNSTQIGFILPALVVFSLILASMGVVALQYVTASSSAIQSTNFNAVAKSAADAGIQHALSCIESQIEDWSTLTPDVSCSGETLQDSNILSESGAWRSTYEVDAVNEVNDELLINSTGRVDFFYAGATVASKTFTATTKASVPVSAAGDERAVAQGNAVTKVSAGNAITCAIANMQLYCSGERKQGRMADGNNNSGYYASPINPPAFQNKLVTDIQVNALNHCAIVDGQSYCWGLNNKGSVGNGLRQVQVVGPLMPSNVPTTGVPVFDRTQSRIASPGKSWDNGSQYTCLLNQLRVFCTGSNISAQLGRVWIHCPGWFCSWQIRDDPHHSLRGSNGADSILPQQVYGYAVELETENRYNSPTFYTQSQLRLDTNTSTRPTHIEAGAYNTCTMVNARVFCWGDRFVTDGVDINTAPDDIGNVKSESGWYNSSTLPASAMGVGESTSCLVSNGELYCRGYYAGDGTTAQNAIGVNGPSMPHVRWNLVKATNTGSSALAGVNVEGFNSHSDNYMCAYGDGDAYCWGTGSTSGNVSPNALTPARIIAGTDASTAMRPSVTGVAAGFDHICVVANGSQYCRGYNNYGSGSDARRGSLGTDSLSNYTSSNLTTKSAPVSNTIGLTEGEAATKIASGDNHSCAIANNYVYCWGSNSHGQIGDSSLLNRTQPHGIKNTAGFNPRAATHIAAGARHSCAIIGGDVYCWGDNNYGQLGRGGSIGGTSNEPVKVSMPGNYKATSIDAGTDHTCAIANGRAYCWGRNTRGQLGVTGLTSRTSPVAVASSLAGRNNLSRGNATTGDIPTHITTGANFSCALANAYAYCWGDNTSGQVGLPPTTPYTTTPNQVGVGGGTPVPAGQDEWMALDAGSNFVCGAINQVVRCWGNNSSGQLGRDTGSTHIPGTVTSSQPDQQNVGWKKTTRLTAGTNHACAIANGEAHCWGGNADGKLGIGSTLPSTSNETRRVTRAAGFLQENHIYDISAGGNHTCGIANGKIICWGLNSSGQLGDTTTDSRSTANRWQGTYLREYRSLDISEATVF